ncbi:MAG: CARDB domain-containing protein, partial [Candidatus Micrarchaeota archaeon]
LGYYESATITEANNLYLYVGNIFPVTANPKTALDLTVKSGATPTPTVSPDLPDLMVATVGTWEITVGKVADIPVTVENHGKAKSPATTVKFGEYMSGYRNVPALAPGEIYYMTVSVVVVNQPEIKIKMTVDAENAITESVETNNELTYSIYPKIIPSPSPSPTPAPFSPMNYDIIIKPKYAASPETIRLFDQADRWRFVGVQSGTQTTITGLEDSINYDSDFNDLAFSVVYLDTDRIVVAITGCNTAAKDAVVFKWTGALWGGTFKKLTVEETGQTIQGEQPEIELFPQCQGNVNQFRTVKISDSA